jgi:hypothetical protein
LNFEVNATKKYFFNLKPNLPIGIDAMLELTLEQQGDTMKKVSMNKLSFAILTATCALSMGVMNIAEAAVSPATINVAVTAPTGTAGLNAASVAAFKTATTKTPWLPCTSSAVSFNGTATTLFSDQLQFDLTLDNKATTASTTGSYDTYIFFINYSADGVRAASGTSDAPSDIFYAVTTTPAAGFAGVSLKPFQDGSVSADGLQKTTTLPGDYRFQAAGGPVKVTNTLFGGPIALDASGINLPQGLWGVLAVLVDPTVVDPTVAADTAKLQDPTKWIASSLQTFVLGTPFKTALGTTGTGVCS